uniref:Uncharacterized protein n=1 Tax=Pavo cristatus TaxID=9049 RepID=A0A8C9F411_PAVCR
LVREISRAFPELVASTVDDNDEEFPLIEAADFLPKWRMFFYKGELPIILLPETKEQQWELPAENLTVSEALALLSAHSEEFLAAEPIQRCFALAFSDYIHKYLYAQLVQRKFAQTGAMDTCCSFCPAHSTKPMSWALSW